MPSAGPSADPPVALDELLAHRAWVRSLARGLARDEHEAADAEQAAWVAALRRPPRAGGSLRGWLAVTTRNAVAKLRRSERRRASHEAAAGARDDVVDASDLAARAEAHRRVVEALCRVEEPLRTALLLRYFEGLPVAEAAARAGVGERTFRDRVRRGLSRMREDLEPRFGGRAAFGVALAGLGEIPPHSGLTAVAGGGVVGAGSKLGISVVAALLLGGAMWWSASDPASDPTAAPPGGGTADVLPAQPGGRPSDGDTALRDGRPRARRPEEAVARTDAPGTPTEADAPGDVAAAAPAAPPGVSPPAPAAPPPTAEARLRAAKVTSEWQDATLLRALAEVSQAAGVPVWAPRPIADGGGTRVTFSVDGMQADGVLGMIARMGRLELRVEVDRAVLAPAGAAPADLVPVPFLDDLPRVRTTVLVTDPQGAPVAGATLRKLLGGDLVATTGPDGRAELVAVLPFPRIFARLDGCEDSHNAEPRADRETRLALGGPSARLTVLVHDREGRPAAGAEVRVVAATTGRGPRAADEAFRTGPDGTYVHRSCPARDVRVVVRLAGHGTDSRVVAARPSDDVAETFHLVAEAVVEGVVRNADGTPAPQITVSAIRDADTAGRCVTDAEGRFRIAGLAAGAVTVAAKRTWSESAEASGTLASGETRRVELTLPPSVAGRR